MIQEGSVEQVCVAVVIGTPEEAAAFVRRLAPRGRVPEAAKARGLTVLATAPTTEAADIVTARGEGLDDLDLAVVHLCETASLTTSECLVLAIRARGFANAEVARVLGLSESTVKCHINNALRKLGERRGSRLARVIALAVAQVRGRPVAMTRDHDAWLGPMRIALARLEPKVDAPLPKVASR